MGIAVVEIPGTNRGKRGPIFLLLRPESSMLLEHTGSVVSNSIALDIRTCNYFVILYRGRRERLG